MQFKHSPNPEFNQLVKSLLSPNPAFRLGNLNSGPVGMLTRITATLAYQYQYVTLANLIRKYFHPLLGIMDHPFFSDTDWKSLYRKSAHAPYIPIVKDAADSSNFGTYGEDKPIHDYKGDQNFFVDF